MNSDKYLTIWRSTPYRLRICRSISRPFGPMPTPLMGGGRGMAIDFIFDEKKTTQAAALLIRKNGGSMDYRKLMMLLYLVDRKCLESHERPLTGDQYVWIDNP